MNKGRLVCAICARILLIASTTLAILALLLGIFGLSRPANFVDLFQYYTVDSNLVLAVFTIPALILDILYLAGKNPKRAAKFFRVLELIGVTATTITAITVIAYLVPFMNLSWANAYGISGGQLFLHAISPVLGLLAFILVNRPYLRSWKYAFFGLVFTVIYGGVMVPMVQFGMAPDPYEFLKFNEAQPYISIIYIAAFLVGSYLVAFLLLLLHNIGAKKYLEKPEEAKEPLLLPKPVQEAEELPAPEPEQPAAPAKKVIPASKIKRDPPPTYVVKKLGPGQWQLTMAGARGEVLKFATKSEAVAYARGYIESRGGSYVVKTKKKKGNK